jgi:hypothetical protein
LHCEHVVSLLDEHVFLLVRYLPFKCFPDGCPKGAVQNTKPVILAIL